MATTLSVERNVRRPSRSRPRDSRRLLLKLSWLPFVVPGLGLFLVFEVWPLIQAILLSLYKWDGYSKKVYVGGANYRRALGDVNFWHALGHAGVYTACTVTGKMVFGLGLALLLHRQLAGRAFYRSIVFAPVLMSFVAVGLLWQLIYSPEQGLMNRLLGLLHLANHVNWLGNPHIALFSLVLVDLWKFTGYHTILFLAGLTLVQKELLEAATVDGASPRQQFWHVTLPAIRPIAVVNLIIATAGAINTFDLVYVMTNGGPYGVTELPITFMYRQGFSNSQLGYASAIACLMFVVVGIITVLILRLQRSDGRKS
jgi:raffinose/stachyose/melibiose transport system permease protein